MTRYPAPPSSDVLVAGAGTEQSSRFYVSGGLPWAELDVETGELRVLRSADIAGLDVVDEVALHGDFLVGSAEGIPRFSTRDRGTTFVRLPSRSELGLAGDSSYRAGGPTPSGSAARANEWLLFEEGGVPRGALALPDATFHAFDADAVEALSPADHVDVSGDWAFGFVEQAFEKSGERWFDGKRAVWRVHLPSGRVTVVPEISGYTTLYDERYVLTPGSNFEHYLLDKDFAFSDGTIAVVRRNDEAARVFVLDAESDAFAPIGVPFTHVVAVRVSHGPGYFLVIPEEFDCYCAPPGLDWGPGEPDASGGRQLVLEEDGTMRTVADGVWNFTSDASCVAVASPSSGSFVRDFREETTTTLPSATAWFWLETREN